MEKEKVLKFKKSTFIKSRFNILPDGSAEEDTDLRNSIKAYGFHKDSQITVINANEILDGWRSQKAMDELGLVIPPQQYNYMNYTDGEATNFVLISSTRRNLTPEKWAFIAIQSADLLRTVQKEVEEAKARKLENLRNVGKGIVVPENLGNGDKHENEAKVIVAKKLHTTPYLMEQVANLQAELPAEEFKEIAADVLTDKTTLKKANAEIKKKAQEALSIESDTDVPLEAKQPVLDISDIVPVSDNKFKLGNADIMRLIIKARNSIRIINTKHTSKMANGTFYYAGWKTKVTEIMLELAENLIK
jgi:hypothetical protein